MITLFEHYPLNILEVSVGAPNESVSTVPQRHRVIKMTRGGLRLNTLTETMIHNFQVFFKHRSLVTYYWCKTAVKLMLVSQQNKILSLQCPKFIFDLSKGLLFTLCKNSLILIS